MRRRQASIVLNAGESPSNAPASLPEPPSFERRVLEIRAAASLGRRRSIMRAAFWRSSASGFMLGSHEASVSSLVARVTLRDVGLRHDLCPCGKGRHENLFGSSDAGRPARRPAARADVQRACHRVIFVAGIARGRSPASDRRFPLRELRGFADQRRDLPESGVRDYLGHHEPGTEERRRRHVDGRRPAWPAEFDVLHDVARVSRHAFGGCHREELERPDGLQFEFGVPCPAGRAELARTAVHGPRASSASDSPAAHAALARSGPARPLTTACTPGGLHGG